MINNNHETIQISSSRKTVQVRLNSGVFLEGAINTTSGAFLQKAKDENLLENSYLLVASICNGKLRELTYPIEYDSTLEPITLANSDGARIYRRSLILMLTTAINEIFPKTKVNVSYAVPDGGFYCEVTNHSPFTKSELNTLEAHMHNMVKQNIQSQSAPFPLAKPSHYLNHVMNTTKCA